MDNTIILQAREVDADSHVSNGDWTNVLAQPIVIEEGDQVSIKTSILDTVDDSEDNIEVEEDQTLIIEAIPYICDFASGYTGRAGGAPYNEPVDPATGVANPDRLLYLPPAAAISRPDFGRYYACTSTQSLGQEMYQFVSLTFKARHRYLTYGFAFTVAYYDINGKPRVSTFHGEPHPGHRVHTYTPNEIDDGANVNNLIENLRMRKMPDLDLYKVTVIESSSSPGIHHRYADYDPPAGSDPGSPGTDPQVKVDTQYPGSQRNISINSPVIISHTIDLPAGNYTPDQLCTLINRSCTQNSSGVRQEQVKSQFMMGSDTFFGVQDDNIVINPTGTGPGLHFQVGDTFDFTGPDTSDPNHEVASGYVSAVDAGGKITSIVITNPGRGYKDLTPVPNDNTWKRANNPLGPPAVTYPTNITTNALDNTLVFTSEYNKSSAVTDDGSLKMMRLETIAGNMLIGASQMQLAFDDATKKFFWKYLFTPVYSGDPPAESVQVVKFKNSKTGSTGVEYGVCAGISGVALLRLDDHSGSSNFWFNKLGFDTSITLNSISSMTTAIVTDGGAKTFASHSFVSSIADNPVGRTITESFVGSDALYEKVEKSAAGTYYIPWQLSTSAGGYKAFYSSADPDSTHSLYANESIAELDVDKSGYFLIDIDAITQSLVGSGLTMNSVQAIVSRYYNSGSYTTGDDSTGIVYTHRGGVQMLQSIKVRVLDPDGQVSESLGNDSTVFLQVLKAPKPMQKPK